MSRIDIDDPSPAAEGIEYLMSRTDLFRSAHALVSGLEWGEGFGVYDVLQVARYLEEEDE